jgi:hypothetical protein
LRIIGGGDFGFSLAGNHAVGPQVDLSWDDHSMHGMLGGQLIRLEVEGNRVFGRGALGNLSLVSTLDGDTLDVSGLYGTFRIRLRMNPARVDGTVVRSWFLERSADGVLRGSGADLVAPPAIAQRFTDVRVATLLAMGMGFLSGAALQQPPSAAGAQ